MGKNGIRSVAELAGVSIGTVSKILNPSSSANIRVSAETREKVLAAVKKLDYRPSYGAKLLRGTSTRTIGFASSLPQTHDAVYLTNYAARILNGIGAEASRNQYQVLLIQGEDYRHFMDVKRIDALIMTGFQLRNNPLEEAMLEMFEHFNRRNYPYAVINSGLSGIAPVSIEIDNEAAMKQVASLIVRKGFESVGFAGELTPNPQRHHAERIMYLKRFLDGTGCRFEVGCILNGSGNGVPELPRLGAYNHDDGRAALRFLIQTGHLPRCLVCGNDNIALGVMQEAFLHHLRIPEDLAVIGFDGDYNVDYMNPPLTTVVQPLEEFGRIAVQFLLRRLIEPTCTLSLLREPRLVERGTT